MGINLALIILFGFLTMLIAITLILIIVILDMKKQFMQYKKKIDDYEYIVNAITLGKFAYVFHNKEKYDQSLFVATENLVYNRLKHLWEDMVNGAIKEIKRNQDIKS